MYDLIIIGAGPAGLSAAVYGKRAGLRLLVIEKAPMSGGQVLNTYEVDNYLGMSGMNGFDMGMQFREHADKLGVEFKEAQVTEIRDKGSYKLILTDAGELEAKAVILAAGAVHAHLGAPGEERLSGRGVSYCATCDGAFYRGRTVAVVGGGDVALEDALFLARACSHVYVIHRRDEFRGAKVLQEKVLAAENITVLWDTVVEEICGKEQVEELSLINKKTGEARRLPVQGVFVAVGIAPNTGLFRGALRMDDAGYICAGEDGATNLPGVYAAGDVRTKQLRQIVTAAADGANAVTSVERYLNGQMSN